MRTLWVLNARTRPKKGKKEIFRGEFDCHGEIFLTCKIILLWHIILGEERSSEVVHEEKSKARSRRKCHTTTKRAPQQQIRERNLLCLCEGRCSERHQKHVNAT